MKTDYTPQSPRARFVYLICKNRPRIVLFILIPLTILGSLTIKKKG